MKSYQVIIAGGGNAGISVAAQLKRKNPQIEIAVIEPSEKHYYQPAWSLVGGGVFDIKDTVRTEASVIPAGVIWLKDAVATFQPEQNMLTTKKGEQYTYSFLIVCPGIQLDWDAVEGLKETLGKNGITSNYIFDTAPYTYEVLKSLKPGQKALFTAPGTPVKCGGAPQKVMYLSADYLQKHNIHDVTVEFCTAGGVIFGIKDYADELLKVVGKYGIRLSFKHDLVAIDGPAHKATFKVTAPDGTVTMVEKEFDMIHVTPPQSAPDFIKNSPLADKAGWIDLDKHTLQHTRYPNVFGLGDAGSTPNSKTGAAVRKQAPVVVANVLAALAAQSLPATYNGYGSCPLIVGYGKLILAEFDYDNKRTETFPFDQSKPRWSMWALKKYVLPWMYWNRILKGTA